MGRGTSEHCRSVPCHKYATAPDTIRREPMYYSCCALFSSFCFYRYGYLVIRYINYYIYIFVVYNRAEHEEGKILNFLFLSEGSVFAVLKKKKKELHTE